MATSRKTLVNENISTYGAPGFGRDYTVMNTWEAATDNDLVAAAQSEILECYDDAASFDDVVAMGGATTNASYARIIRPAGTKGQADWQGHDGTPNVGVNFLSTALDDVFTIDDGFCQVQDMIADFNISDGGSYACFKLDNGSGNDLMACIGCIAIGDGNAGGGSITGFEYQCEDSNQRFMAVNCIAIRCELRGFEQDGATATNNRSVFLNCTAIDCDTGFEQSAGPMVCRNCLAENSTSADFAGTITGNNNASSDGTAPGTSARTNQTFTFQAAGSDDYHLDILDAGARDYGASLASDPDYPFDDDIDWRLRVAAWLWDIGADEYFSPYPIISDEPPRSLIFGNRIVR